MNLLKIGTDDQVADALTKALPKLAFTAHSGVMMNIKTTTRLPEPVLLYQSSSSSSSSSPKQQGCTGVIMMVVSDYSSGT
eukprot:988526-Rhodomonas_salina.1